MIAAIRFAWKGKPWDDVEILTDFSTRRLAATRLI